MEKTLIILKPDALQRGLAGRIITRFEENLLAIVGAGACAIGWTIIGLSYRRRLRHNNIAERNAITTALVVIMVCEFAAIVCFARSF